MRPPRRPEPVQLDLFAPLPQRPTWTTLPPEARVRALTLLARLLRAARDRRLAAGEVGRE